MSSNDLNDALLFLQSDDREPLRLQPDQHDGAASFGTWLFRGTVLGAIAAIVVALLYYKEHGEVPGPPQFDATEPPVIAPSTEEPSPVPPPARGRVRVLKSILTKSHSVDAEGTDAAEKEPDARPEGDLPKPAPEAKSRDEAPRKDAPTPPTEPTQGNKVDPVVSPQGPTANVAPLEFLKSMGLTQSGAYFLLASESEVYQGLKGLRPNLIRMAEAGDALVANAEVEATFQELDDTRIRLEEQLRHLLLAIPQMPRRTLEQKAELEQAMVVQYQTRQDLVTVNANIEVVNKRRLSPKQLAKLQDDFQARRRDFLQAASEFRPVFDKVKKQYDELKNDSRVIRALNAYGEANRFKAQLGPSLSFRKGVGTVIEAERTYSPETAPARVRAKRKTLQ
ncbi:MAG: hypothetical protein P4L84_27590 [Isosphaeraceae bacterium]|nr:hypothetical protein [Isosphaeraceae bacterium]